ncbi:hypothetical protein NIA69_01630 [Gemmiger formicilis]|nr:hypothetical protein [Gemmiger formicilis]
MGGTEIKAAPLDKRGIFWRLSAISRQWPARTGKRCLKTLVGFLAVSARKMLFPLKLILRFRDRLTIKRHLPLQGLDKYDALYGCNLRRAFSEISGLPEQRIQFINDAAAFALGK